MLWGNYGTRNLQPLLETDARFCGRYTFAPGGVCTRNLLAQAICRFLVVAIDRNLSKSPMDFLVPGVTTGHALELNGAASPRRRLVLEIPWEIY